MTGNVVGLTTFPVFVIIWLPSIILHKSGNHCTPTFLSSKVNHFRYSHFVSRCCMVHLISTLL